MWGANLSKETALTATGKGREATRGSTVGLREIILFPKPGPRGRIELFIQKEARGFPVGESGERRQASGAWRSCLAT